LEIPNWNRKARFLILIYDNAINICVTDIKINLVHICVSLTLDHVIANAMDPFAGASLGLLRGC
jgi:hypothetical protein